MIKAWIVLCFVAVIVNLVCVIYGIVIGRFLPINMIAVIFCVCAGIFLIKSRDL